MMLIILSWCSGGGAGSNGETLVQMGLVQYRIPENKIIPWREVVPFLLNGVPVLLENYIQRII